MTIRDGSTHHYDIFNELYFYAKLKPNFQNWAGLNKKMWEIFIEQLILCGSYGYWGPPKHLALLPTIKPLFRLHVLFILQIKSGFCFEYSLWLNKIAFTHPPPSLSPYINERGDYIAVGGTAVYCPSLWDGMGRLFCADSTLETKLTFSCNTMQCHAQAHRL